MAEYIRRDLVLELAREYYTPALKEEAVPVKAIKNIPSADVAKVRHGKWEEGLCYDYYSKGVLESKCSICGSWNLFDFNGYNCESNFCPNCGADMRKDGK